MLFTEKDIKEWGDSLKKYQFEKKEKSIEPVKINKITHKEIKQKEIQYHPILQKYKENEKELTNKEKEIDKIKKDQDKIINNTKKYEKNYDIITIEARKGGVTESPERQKKVLMSSNQVDYNIITNNKIEETLTNNYSKIPSKINRNTQKKVDFHSSRDFNIISNHFVKNDEELSKQLETKQKEEAYERFNKLRVYNCVNAEYYNKEKEQKYQEERKENQKIHGQDFSKRYPPSWKFRETVIMDPSKEIPQEIKTIDIQNRMRKKRFELRYDLEQQYRERDIEFQERKNFRIRNKVNTKKYLDEHKKGFNIINLGDIPDHIVHIDKYINTKPFTSTWEKLQMTSHNKIDKNYNTNYVEKRSDNIFNKENLFNSTNNFNNVSQLPQTLALPQALPPGNIE